MFAGVRARWNRAGQILSLLYTMANICTLYRAELKILGRVFRESAGDKVALSIDMGEVADPGRFSPIDHFEKDWV